MKFQRDDEHLVSRFYRGARYGTLGGGTTETLKDLVGTKLISDFDPVDGFFGIGTFCPGPRLSHCFRRGDASTLARGS